MSIGVSKELVRKYCRMIASPRLLTQMFSHVNSERYLLVIWWFMWNVVMGTIQPLTDAFHWRQGIW